MQPAAFTMEAGNLETERMSSLVQQKQDRLRMLLTGPTADEFVDIMRGLMQSDDAESVLVALKLLVEAGPELSAPLLGDLVALFTSPLQVHRLSLGERALEHQPICMAAADAVLALGVPPAAEALEAVMLDPKPLTLPAEAYDQGAAIGDYAVLDIRPAALAAQAAALLGESALLLSEPIVALLADGTHPDDWRVTRTLNLLVKAAPGKPASSTAGLKSALEALAAEPRVEPWRRDHARQWLKSAGLAG